MRFRFSGLGTSPAEEELKNQCHAEGGTWILMPDGGGYGCTYIKPKSSTSMIPSLVLWALQLAFVLYLESEEHR